MEYTIAAIPTVYRGRRYRSRLEARWAAFFDQLGWRHEYEPFDLGKWSPDFLLPDGGILVEVKPITAFDRATADRMSAALKSRGMRGEFSMLLVGTSPFTIEDVTVIGWKGRFTPEQGEVMWHPTPVLWYANPDKPKFDADVMQVHPTGLRWAGCFTNAGGSGLPDVELYSSHTMGLWVAATNEVQWKPQS